MSVKVYKGVRYREAWTHQHRYGFGKRHLMIYVKAAKEWRISCRLDAGGSSGVLPYPIHDEPDEGPVLDCKNCAAVLELVFGRRVEP